MLDFKSKRAIQVLATAALVASLGSATSSHAQDDDDLWEANSGLPESLRTSGVASIRADGAILIDMRHAPANIDELLSLAYGELDGKVVVLEGMPTRDPRAQREADNRLAPNSQITGAGRCDELPSLPGSGVRAYLGCGEGSGHRFSDLLEGDSDPLRLAAALALASTQYAESALGLVIPSSDLAPEVDLADGLLRVNFPPLFAEKLGSPAQSGELERWLLITAMTAPTVDSVEFLAGGDCLRFSVAVGGDSCAGRITRTDLQGEILP